VLGSEKCQRLLNFISSNKDNISHVDLETRKRQHSKGIEKLQRITHMEQYACSHNILMAMNDGGNIFNILNKIEEADQIKT
jgi:hypothetical protein